MGLLTLCSYLLILSCSSTAQKEQALLVDANATEIVEHIALFEGEKPVLVNFWATWCIPCVEEFPYIKQLKEKYGDGFELVFVSGDLEEAKKEARQFFSGAERGFHHLL